jgi:hypothetical protein
MNVERIFTSRSLTLIEIEAIEAFLAGQGRADVLSSGLIERGVVVRLPGQVPA